MPPICLSLPIEAPLTFSALQISNLWEKWRDIISTSKRISFFFQCSHEVCFFYKEYYYNEHTIHMMDKNHPVISPFYIAPPHSFISHARPSIGWSVGWSVMQTFEMRKTAGFGIVFFQLPFMHYHLRALFSQWISLSQVYLRFYVFALFFFLLFLPYSIILFITLSSLVSRSLWFW